MSMKNKAKHFTTTAAFSILGPRLRFKGESSKTIDKSVFSSAFLFIVAVVLRILYSGQALVVIFTTECMPDSINALFFKRFAACKLWHEDCLIY